MKTGLFTLGSKDLIKGGIIAILTAIVAGLTTIVNGLTLTPPVYPTWTDLVHVGMTGLAAGAIYILKNFLTNGNDQFLKKDA